eukprot:gene12080-5573_t
MKSITIQHLRSTPETPKTLKLLFEYFGADKSGYEDENGNEIEAKDIEFQLNLFWFH